MQGVVATSGGSLTLNAGGVNVHTTAPITDAVDLTGASITATLADLTTDGTAADGIVTNSTGNTTLTVGDISGLHNGGIGAKSNDEPGRATSISPPATSQSASVRVSTRRWAGIRQSPSTTSVRHSLALTVTSSTGSIDLTSGAVTANGWTAVSLSTAGAITYSGEDLDTQDADSIGLLISGGAGAIDVTVGDVSTQGLNSTGIDITGTGSIAIDSDTVSTAAPITDAVHLTGGTITGTLGNLTTDGTGSDGIVTNSTGNTTLTVGDISGLHNGGIAANLTTTGSGDLDFTAGNIAVGFGQGLNATVGGNSTITVDDVSSAFSGITVTSSTGSIDLTSGAVTANGWTAVSLSTAGAITYSGEDLDTQDADSIGLLISGGAGAIDVTVGDVSTQGLNSTGIDITGTGSIAIDSDTVSTAAPITDAVHLTGGTITGTLGNLTTDGTGSDGIVTNSTGNTT
jgi:hypothetical protein